VLGIKSRGGAEGRTKRISKRLLPWRRGDNRTTKIALQCMNLATMGDVGVGGAQNELGIFHSAALTAAPLA